MILRKALWMDDHSEDDQDHLDALRHEWRAMRLEGSYSGDINLSRENRLLFGAFIRAEMTAQGFTTQSLADAVDMTAADLTALLGGQFPLYKLNEDMLGRLAAAIKISPRTLGLFINRFYPDDSPPAASDDE